MFLKVKCLQPFIYQRLTTLIISSQNIIKDFYRTPKPQVAGSNPAAPVNKKALQLGGCRAFIMY